MRNLLLTSLAAVALVGAARAWGPCSDPCPCLPFPYERQVVSCFRTETRTEMRPVPRKVYRTVTTTATVKLEEKVLVPFWRDEVRTCEPIHLQEKEEKHANPALIVDCEDEKQTRTLMVPKVVGETRSRTVCDLVTVPELVKKVIGCPVPLPACCGCADPMHALAHLASQYHATSEVVYHLVPAPRDVKETFKVELFDTKDETCKIQVPTYKDAPPLPGHYLDAQPVPQKQKVQVLDFREETRTREVPVTTYRTVEETVMELAPCTVEVQVPCHKVVWVPICPRK